MKQFISLNIFTLILISSFLVFPGCEDNDDHHAEESQDEHVCEHLADGPIATLTASTTAEAAIAALNSDNNYRIQAQLHTRYDITFLQDSTMNYSGYIPYLPIDGDGDYLLYLDTDATVALLNHSEGFEEVEAENSADHSDDCELVHLKNTFHLHADDEYVIHVLTASPDPVGMLFPKHSGEDECDH